MARYRYRVYVERLGLLSPSATQRERAELTDELDDVSTSFAIFDGDDVVGSLRLTLLDDVVDASPLHAKFGFTDVTDRFGSASVCITSRFIAEPSARGTA